MPSELIHTEPQFLALDPTILAPNTVIRISCPPRNARGYAGFLKRREVHKLLSALPAWKLCIECPRVSPASATKLCPLCTHRNHKNSSARAEHHRAEPTTTMSDPLRDAQADILFQERAQDAIDLRAHHRWRRRVIAQDLQVEGFWAYVLRTLTGYDSRPRRNVGNPVTNPVVNPITHPVVNPVTNPVVNPVTNPVVNPVVNPVANPVPMMPVEWFMNNLQIVQDNSAFNLMIVGATNTGKSYLMP